jgi:hypothetical protein
MNEQEREFLRNLTLLVKPAEALLLGFSFL